MPQASEDPWHTWELLPAHASNDRVGQHRSNDSESLGPVEATISRILDNEKYAGRWIWNKTESRRDPRTGRRRRFDKPESEWVIHENEQLRIVPKPLWRRGASENKTLVRRTLTKEVILGAVRRDLRSSPIAYVLKRVEEEIAKLRSDLPDTLKLKEAELTAEQ